MRILIVDDDTLIRKWLTMLLRQIPDREIAVEKAENGLQALQLLQRGPLPDLVITDIKMPQMDGLSLFERIKQDYPGLPVVVLSSYNEFAYAKKALQLGALDYILKTDMSADDITAIINRVADDRSSRGADGSLAANGQLLHSFLTDSDMDDSTFLLHLDPHLTPESLILVLFRTDRPLPEGFSPTLTLRDAPLHATLAPCGERDTLAFLHIDRTAVMDKKTAVGLLLSCLRRQTGFSLQTWSSTLNCSEIGVFASIQTCRSVLKYKHYYGLEDFSAAPYHEEGEFSPASRIPAYSRFFEMINRYQMQQATDLLRSCMEAFHMMYCHPSDIEKYLSLMCHKLLADISVLEVKIDWFDHTLQLLHEAASAPTRELCRDGLNAFLSQCAQVFSSVKKQRPDAVSKALAFIDEHYAEKITLEQVASHVHMHSTYMSEYFKKETGVTFNDYVNNLRIIHSCELLRFTDLAIGQISERCGFTDQNYFTKVFKKYAGSTPSQYRASFQSGGQDGPV